MECMKINLPRTTALCDWAARATTGIIHLGRQFCIRIRRKTDIYVFNVLPLFSPRHVAPFCWNVHCLSFQAMLIGEAVDYNSFR